MKTYYIHRGRVTDCDAHGDRASVGDVEWQFSDGLYTRSSSQDFLSLEEGLTCLAPAVFVMADSMPPLSPYAVDAMMRAADCLYIQLGEWKFTLSGPVGTPHENLNPTAHCESLTFSCLNPSGCGRTMPRSMWVRTDNIT